MDFSIFSPFYKKQFKKTIEHKDPITKKNIKVEVTIDFDFSRYRKRGYKEDLMYSDWIFGKTFKTEKEIPDNIKKMYKSTTQYDIPFNAKVSECYQYIKKANPNFKLENVISYRDYRKITSEFLALFIFQILNLEENREITLYAPKNKLNIQVIIGTGIKENVYAMFVPEGSSTNTLNFFFSGSVLMGRFCVPNYFKINQSAFMLKTLMNVIQHAKQFNRGIYALREKSLQKLNSKSSAQITHEYFEEVFTEGVATFHEKQYAQKIVIDLTKIEAIKRNIRDVAKAYSHEEALKQYYEPNIDSEGSVYYLGYMMAVTICLAQAQILNLPIKALSVHSKKEIKEMLNRDMKKYCEEFKEQKMYPVSLSRILGTVNSITIGSLPEKARLKTIELLNDCYDFEDFVNHFEQATRILGWYGNTQFFSKQWYEKILQITDQKPK